LLSIGGAEWTREGLRKPYVIGHYMFVNGVRLPSPASVLKAPAGSGGDPFAMDSLLHTGVLAASPWVHWPLGSQPGAFVPANLELPQHIAVEAALGREVFLLQCAVCHSIDHYNAIRPLVQGKSSATLAGLLDKLATPVGHSTFSAAAWSDPGLQLDTWRGRRMPPFAGNDAEARALSVYLAQLGGGEITPPPAPATGERSGAQQFEDVCAMCHAAGGDRPITRYLKGRGATEFYEFLGRLPQVNAQMPPYEGGDTERRALAEYLADLAKPNPAH
jgi:mono/diheme cytochrome c family protein